MPTNASLLQIIFNNATLRQLPLIIMFYTSTVSLGLSTFLTIGVLLVLTL